MPSYSGFERHNDNVSNVSTSSNNNSCCNCCCSNTAHNTSTNSEDCCTCCQSQRDHACGRFLNNYRGPLIVVAIGIGFMLVGAVPVAVATATHTKGSAMIIGAGFIGFGLLICLPGLVWCVVQRLTQCQYCCCCTNYSTARRLEVNKNRNPNVDDEDDDDGDEDEDDERVVSRKSGVSGSIVGGGGGDYVVNLGKGNEPSLKYIQKSSLLEVSPSSALPRETKSTPKQLHDTQHCNHGDNNDGIMNTSSEVILSMDSHHKDDVALTVTT